MKLFSGSQERDLVQKHLKDYQDYYKQFGEARMLSTLSLFVGVVFQSLGRDENDTAFFEVFYSSIPIVMKHELVTTKQDSNNG